MHVKRQVLFVQGGGEGAHDRWDDKLVDSLVRELGPGYEVRYPRMPDEDDPRYAAWKRAIEAELDTLDDRAVLVGHSIGGSILANVVAAQSRQRRFGAIVLLAAPFVGEGGWPSEDLATPHDLGARLPEHVPVYIYYGSNDDTAPPSHAELYARAIPQAQVHRLPGRDHQFDDDLREAAAAIKSLDADARQG